GGAPLTFDGEFYKVAKLTLAPKLAPELRPGYLMSGSSEAGMATAKELGAVAVQYPEPPRAVRTKRANGCNERGIRIGIVTRPNAGDAWKVALQRFPEDRSGQLTRHLTNNVSDSAWRQPLDEAGCKKTQARETYWLHPFENYQ